MDTQKSSTTSTPALNGTVALPRKTARTMDANPPVVLPPTQPDSFTAQKPTAHPKKEVEKDDKSWVLPVAIAGGLLTLGGALLLFNRETREKILPFLKKKTEDTAETVGKKLDTNGKEITEKPWSELEFPDDLVGSPPKTETPVGTTAQLPVEEPLVIVTEPAIITTASLSNNPITGLPSVDLSTPMPIVPTVTNVLNTATPYLTAGEDARSQFWTLVVRDITGKSRGPHWISNIETVDFSTADLQHFQEQCFSAVKDPHGTFNKDRGGFFQPSALNTGAIKNKLTFEGLGVNHCIMKELQKQEKGTLKRGLSSEDNHLALAYAYYNKALMLAAKGGEEFHVREAFKACKKHLEPLEFTERKSDGEFLYDLAKGYLGTYSILNT
jgi:hypothetical protein